MTKNVSRDPRDTAVTARSHPARDTPALLFASGWLAIITIPSKATEA